MTKLNGQPLRFAALIRVSTEKQEKQGESLRTQDAQIEQAVASLGGKIVVKYAGQEHATAGWEREQRDKMLAAAEKPRKPFDAVMVAHADRWSRDDTRSGADLDRLKRAGVRFFVLDQDQDLSDPTKRLYLGMSAVIGAYHARNQNQKSLLNRIARAQRGRPSAGKLPYGRFYDQKTETWGIDPVKKAFIQEVAKRYLAGEHMRHLADEFGVSQSRLHKTLMHRCGTSISQTFHSDDLNIHEVVPITIPALLPEETIAALHKRAAANKTYEHGQAKHQYLFGGFVYCAKCGRAMFGQANREGRLYYRHLKHSECPCPTAWIRADQLEEVVIRHLFECFGNPVAIQKAIEEATPNREKVIEYRERQRQLEEMLAKNKAARARILRHIVMDSISEADAKNELGKLKTSDECQRTEFDRLEDSLKDMPSAESIREFATSVATSVATKFQSKSKSKSKPRQFASARKIAIESSINHDFGAMTWNEKRELVKKVFDGKTVEGRRMGVFITWIDGEADQKKKRWRYSVDGHLIHRKDYFSVDHEDIDDFFVFGNPVVQCPSSTHAARP